MDAEGDAIKHAEQVQRWLRYINQDVEECKRAIEEKKKELNEYGQLQTKVADLTKLLEKNVYLPIGKVAFISGTLDRTNEFYTLLGANTFAKKSSHSTIQLLERRKTSIKKHLAELSEELKLVESRKDFSEQLTKMNSEELEIREPYDESAKPAVSKHELHRVTKDEHAEVMSRLEQLEKEEDEQKEHAAEAAAAATLVNDLPPPPLDIGTRSLQAPKGVPQKDFDLLLKRLSMEDSDDEEDEEAEVADAIEELDEQMDSDERSSTSSDSEPVVETVNSKITEMPMPTGAPAATPSIEQPKSSATIKQLKKRKSVQFNDAPLDSPTLVAAPILDAPAPTSILRHTDHVPRVNRQEVDAMDRRDQKLMLPESKDALKGVIRERDPLGVLPTHPNTPNVRAADGHDKRGGNKVSKFKQQRQT